MTSETIEAIERIFGTVSGRTTTSGIVAVRKVTAERKLHVLGEAHALHHHR